jgi:thiol-disulfide isomerase/thioredoxin
MRVCLALILALGLIGGLPLCGDVIYLKNGNVIVVEKAWEEGDQVKYQASSGIQTIPRTAVQRLQGQKASPADPSHKKTFGVEVIRGTGAPVRASVKSSAGPATTTIRLGARSERFQDSAGYEEALRLHRATGKPVALYFYTDWCPYCAELERTILSSSEVKHYLDNTLYVSVNPEHGKAEKALFASFKRTGYPTFLILGKDQAARAVPTSGSPDAFAQACKAAGQAGSQ